MIPITMTQQDERTIVSRGVALWRKFLGIGTKWYGKYELKGNYEGLWDLDDARKQDPELAGRHWSWGKHSWIRLCGTEPAESFGIMLFFVWRQSSMPWRSSELVPPKAKPSQTKHAITSHVKGESTFPFVPCISSK